MLFSFFALAAGTLGCGAETPLGSSGAPDAYRVRPLNPGAGGQQPVESVVGAPEGSGPQPEWLVRVSDANRSIRGIAVSEQYVYFVAWWEGIYRVAKTGGAVEVVEAAQNTQFEPATATANAVYWVRTTFDKDDYPHLHIRRRLDDGSPSQLLFEGDWAVAQSSHQSTFQADDSGVYMVAHRAGGLNVDLHRVTAGSGQMQPVVTFNRLPTPSWLLQPEGLYLLTCACPSCPSSSTTPPLPPAGSDNQMECTISITAKGGDGTLVPLASLPRYAELSAADAENLYLLGGGVWQVSKQGGAPVQVGPAAESARSGRFLLVDETNVYFSTGTGNATQLWALPKAGGSPTLVGGGIPLVDVWQIVQDRDRFYVLRGNGRGDGVEISVVSKR
jgi:hypothetical protein